MSLAFSEFRLGSLLLKNRVVMAPMQQYQGTAEGYATAYHEQHYARRARGGVGLVMVESTAVAPEGRLLRDDIGIFSDAHAEPLRRVAAAVHVEGVPIILQLSHGGRKSTPPAGFERIAPSPIAYDDTYGVPREMSPADIAAAVDAFAAAAACSRAIGYDGIEIHAAHGFLIHQFLSPLSNTRTDAYGGSAAARQRFLAEIVEAVRGAVGTDYPVAVRVSASDYAEGGLTPDDVGRMLRDIAPLGIDAVDVSSGGLLPGVPPNIGPGYQVPFAQIIKTYVDVPVIAVGLIRSGAMVEEILSERRADLVAIGRPLLIYPDLNRTI